jgi:hypothetical protein
MSYKQLTQEKRYVIFLLNKRGETQNKIGKFRSQVVYPNFQEVFDLSKTVQPTRRLLITPPVYRTSFQNPRAHPDNSVKT